MDDIMKSLLKRAAKSPEDYTLLGVAADRACECGYTSLERTLRWMVATQRWPVGDHTLRWMVETQRWPVGDPGIIHEFCWQHLDGNPARHPCRSLPARLCSRMGIAATPVPARYSSFFVAIAALALALELEPQEN